MTTPQTAPRRTGELIEALRTMIETTRQTVQASQDLIGRLPPRAPCALPLAASNPTPARPIRDVTEDLADALLHVHGLTTEDYDPPLREMVEKALFRVGQRLAQGMGPKACGAPLQS
jgi:hypothetical protein